MLTVHKQSWSGNITVVWDFHWKIGKMGRRKKIQTKLSHAYTLRNQPHYLTGNEWKRNTGKKEAKSCNSVLLLSLINILGIVHRQDVVQPRKYILLGVTVSNSWPQDGLHPLEPSSPCNKPSQWKTCAGCAPQEQSSTPDQFYRSLPRDEHHYIHAMDTPLSSLNHLTKWTDSLQQKATPSVVTNLLFRLLPCHRFADKWEFYFVWVFSLFLTQLYCQESINSQA